MHSKQNLYDQAAKDAKHIADIAAQLEFLAHLEAQGVLQDGKIRPDYEKSCLRDIKNCLSNIYLVLDLHEIRGIADQIFNADFAKQH